MIPQMQTNNGTYYGRYWTEMAVLSRYFARQTDLRILSFGCATGEELLLLSRLFPGAQLYGADIDWASLLAARALLGDRAIVFDSARTDLGEVGPFDIIICNSVLLSHSTDTPGGRKALPATAWLEALDQIDAALVPGGILQIVNSNFPFRLHPRSADYRPLRSPLILGPNFVDFFDLEGELICRGTGGTGFSPVTHSHVAGPAWESAMPQDFTDVHFQKAGGRPLDPILDQRLPNLADRPPLMTGRSTVGPAAPPARATHQTVTLAWHSLGVEGVRIERQTVRTWFDGSSLAPTSTVIEMQGPLATAFMESILGRPSTTLTLEALEKTPTIVSPLF